MISTRSKPTLFNLPSGSDNPYIKELQIGGRAGRLTSGHKERKQYEAYDNMQWNLSAAPSTSCHTAQTVPLCLPCGIGAKAPPPLPPSPKKELNATVLIGTEELKANVGEHLACKKCVHRHILRTVHNYTAWFDAKFRQRILNELDNTPNDSTRVLEKLSQENIASKMWLSYTKTPGYRQNMFVEKKAKLDVKMESKGLATYVTANCHYRSRKLPSGHCIPLHLPRKDGRTHAKAFASYDINKQSVLMAHHMGSSWWSMSCAFSTLGVKYMGQHPYENAEDVVGRAIKTVAKKSMKDALVEEIVLSKEAGDGTYQTEEYGELPSLTMGTDAGWQRRASGRLYNSASGVVHFVGVHTGKVCDTRLSINRCQMCEKIKVYKEKIEKGKARKKESNIQKFKTKMSKIKTHRCLKNFWGTSKAMEADSIVRLVRNFPKKRKAYIRALVMDDDATTPAHLGEDTGANSKGCLPKSLTGIQILADPSHRKRVVGVHFTSSGEKK